MFWKDGTKEVREKEEEEAWCRRDNRLGLHLKYYTGRNARVIDTAALPMGVPTT